MMVTGVYMENENNAVRETHYINIPQSMLLAVLSGICASIVGAFIWALITVATRYQIGFMAMGVGALVGLSIRFFGQSDKPVFGIVGAAVALFGCLLGNVFSQYGFYAVEAKINILDVVSSVPFTLIPQLIAESAQPMDFLFYLIAIYEGFKFSINKPDDVRVNGELTNGLPPRYPKLKKIFGLVMGAFLLAFCVFLFGLINREYTHCYPSGAKQFQGRMMWNRAEGEWRYWNEDGTLIAVINFRNNRKDGAANFYYPNGKQSSEEYYSKGLLHGPVRLFSEEGAVTLEGTYEYGRQKGVWKNYYDDGTISNEGEYELDKPIGVWKYWYENGSIKEIVEYTGDEERLIIEAHSVGGETMVSEANGIYSSFYDSGELLSRGEIKNGRKTGLWKSWYESGRMRDEFDHTGEHIRLIRFWSAGGRLLIADGSGDYIVYDENGNKSLEAHYKNGRLEGEFVAYNGEGNVFSTSMYSEGLEHGESVIYHGNGEKYCCGDYKDGRRDGEWIWWNEDGSLSSKVNFIDGKKEGIQEFWEDDIKIKEEEYSNGEYIKTTVL